VTSHLEYYLARRIYYELRSHAGAPSRRKLPTKLSAKVSVGDNESSVDLAVKDHPFALMLPIWDYPGVIRQVQPSSDFLTVNVRAYNFLPADLRETLGLPEDAPDPMVHVGPGTIDNVLFARGIAKIGYCNAVAKYGLDGFRHLVAPDIILGRYTWVPYFVGSEPGDPPPPQPGVRHLVELSTMTGRLGLRLLQARVRLFASSGTAEHGMPIYYVVMGAPR
jgi:hypothetical protein